MWLSVDSLRILVYRKDKECTLEAHNLTQYEQSKERVDMTTLRKHRVTEILCA